MKYKFLCLLLLSILLASCWKNGDISLIPAPQWNGNPSVQNVRPWTGERSPNPAALVKKECDKDFIESLRNVWGGHFYTMRDYRDTPSALPVQLPLKGKKAAAELQPDKVFGFVARTPEGELLCCRNYNTLHGFPCVAVFNQPKNGASNVILADARDCGSIEYTDLSLHDGETDLSRLLTASCVPSDGMNCHGLAVSVVHPAAQASAFRDIQFTAKKILSKCRSVNEALRLLEQENFCAPGRLFLADSSGRAVCVESPAQTKSEAAAKSKKCSLKIQPVRIFGENPQDSNLQKTFSKQEIRCTVEQAIRLLSSAAIVPAQEENSNETKQTSSTSWSVVYNLNTHVVHLCLRGDYRKVFMFSLDEMLKKP